MHLSCWNNQKIPYPLAEKYPGVSSYTYCMNNPVNLVDPDGRDGVVTGTGTVDNPYVVTANYYYYGLNKDQAKGVNDAVASYNNGGKAWSYKDGNGNTIYVQISLTATEAKDVDSAKEMASNDVVRDDDGKAVVRYGNTITSGTTNDPNELGHADNFRKIILNSDTTEQHAKEAPRESLANIYKATSIHEIGHNLGENHVDIGDIMNKSIPVEEQKSGCIGNCGTGVYRWDMANVSSKGIQALMGRMDAPRGTVNSSNMTAKQNGNISPNDGTVGILKRVAR